MIKTVNLTKRYGTLVALSNLNLEIDEGDCFGFIGPNGAGKSTTIKILATLLQPTWGEARVCDYVVGYQSRLIRPLIGYVPDYFGAYEDMVVQEYLEFFAAAYNINGPARTKIVNDVLELTDLGYKRDALVDGLSRGMKQRLSIGRVLVHDPKVLLLDEPAGNLDPRARIEMRELLKELQRREKTILISSHILPELADLCNKVGVIEQGELLYSGPVSDIVRRRAPVLYCTSAWLKTRNWRRHCSARIPTSPMLPPTTATWKSRSKTAFRTTVSSRKLSSARDIGLPC